MLLELSKFVTSNLVGLRHADRPRARNLHLAKIASSQFPNWLFVDRRLVKDGKY